MLLNCGLDKTLESPLDCKKIYPVNPKRNQSWIFIGRADVEAETPIVWPPDGKSWLTGKDPDAGKDWRQEKGRTEDEMVGRHHRLDGHEFEQAPGVGDGQGGLACCSPWGRTESDTTERLNRTELMRLSKQYHLLRNNNVNLTSLKVGRRKKKVKVKVKVNSMKAQNGFYLRIITKSIWGFG